MNTAVLRAMIRRALIATAGIALWSNAAAYAQEWKAQGKYQTKPMGPAYSDREHIRYDPGNNVLYLNDEIRAQFKVEFKTDPDGVRRAYRGSQRLDTHRNGELKRALFVMDADGALYVVMDGWIPGQPRLQHSTVPAGQDVASAGHIKAEDGVIKFLDNHSGHYTPENAHLVQAIESLEAQGAPKGTYEVDFTHYDHPGEAYVALDPKYQQKLARGEILEPDAIKRPQVEDPNKKPAIADDAGPVKPGEPTKAAEPDVNRGARDQPPSPNGPEVAKVAAPSHGPDAYAHVPRYFYRVGMLEWNKMKDPDNSGKRFFNLFLGSTLLNDAGDENARHFLGDPEEGGGKYGGDDRTIYRLSKANLAKTAAGRAFLAEVETEIVRYPERVDMTLMLSDETSFVETVKNNAEVWYRESRRDGPPRQFGEYRVPPSASSPRPPPAAEPIAREVAPAPVEPTLEAEIVDLLKLKSTDVNKLAQDRDAGNWDIFKHDLFKPPTDSKDGVDAVVRAWKKASAKFPAHSKLLAEMRWKMFVDLWAEVARDHGVPIELLDSGKRNAYSSDIDVTIYVPEERRGKLDVATLIKEVEHRFVEIYKYPPAALDITIHNGDVFMPDVRNHGQSLAEYTKSLREVVSKLRLKVSPPEPTKPGDASYVPGANLEDVQKRGMRDGIGTSLEPVVEVVAKAADGTPLKTRFVKPKAREFRVSDFSPTGEVVSKSARFQRNLPAYDRSNAFGNLVQNFEKVYRNGDDHAAVAKLFNRGMDLGAGAGRVNTFMDIHVSDLPVGVDLPVEEAARIAFALEAPDTPPEERSRLREKGRTKAVTKFRWIVRSFGYDKGPAVPGNVIWLYHLLNTSAEMEVDKNKKRFDWKAGRERYMKRYFDEAKAAYPELAATADGVEKLHEHGWRMFSAEISEAFENAMVKTAQEALRDLTPEGLRRNAWRLTDQRSREKGRASAEAAKKLAAQRRLELALTFEIIERHRITKNPVFDKLTPEEEYHREHRNPRLEALREGLLNSAPDALKADIKKLDQIARTQMDNYLAEFDQAGTTPEQLQTAKEQAVARVTEVSPEAAGAKVSDQELREHIQRNVLLKTSPADAPATLKMLDALAKTLRVSITSEPSKANPRPVEGGAFVQQAWNNMTPLMVSSSVVNLARAYQAGGEKALTEAAVGEAFNFLPPAYGIIGIAMKDFSRGHVTEGLYSLAWLGGIHFADYWVPGAGQALLVFNIATGVPHLVYAYTAEKITEDLLEQALKSEPVPGTRARRNPYKDSPDLFKGDRPEFPIFWDDPCMNPEEDRKMSPQERFVTASHLFRGEIAKELDERFFKPEPRRNWQGRGAAPPARSQAEEQRRTKGSAEWAQEEYRLTLKYAFDLPYYRRMARIYDCYFPRVKELRDKGVDEDRVLEQRFRKVVFDWFEKQPDGYKLEFRSMFGTEESAAETRTQLLAALTNSLVSRYKYWEAEPVLRQWKLDSIQKSLEEQTRRRVLAEKQLIATNDAVLDRLEKQVEQLALSAAGTPGAAPSLVRIKAPTWYVNMTEIIGERELVERPVSKVARLLMGDEGAIPIDVVVQADMKAHSGAPAAWTHDFKLALDETAGPAITRGKPAGFVPSDFERPLLEETWPDGRPKLDVFTIRMKASASVYDAKGAPIGQAKPATVMGYVLGEILEEITVPDLSAFASQTEMDSALRHVRLTGAFGPAKAKTPSKDKEFKLASQAPDAGSKAKRGDTVTVALYPKFVDDSVTVPDVSRIADPAHRVAKLDSAGLKATHIGAGNAPSPDSALKVAGQKPKAGAKAKRGDVVVISVYQPNPGLDSVTVPDVTGIAEGARRVARLDSAGLKATHIGAGNAPSPDRALKVADQKPKAGAKAKRGDVVTISVYQPFVEDSVTVPAVAGLDSSAAGTALAQAGLTAAFAPAGAAPSKESESRAATQSEPPGKKVKRGTPVTVGILQEYKEPVVAEVTVPDLSGMDSASAAAALQQAELVAAFASPDEPRSPDDKFSVATQSEPAGKQVPRGSPVTVALAKVRTSGEVIVPDLSGLNDEVEMQAALDPFELNLSVAPSVPAPSLEEEFTFAFQAPEAYTKVARKSTVTVTQYGEFARSGAVPDVKGLTLEQAVARLAAENLTVTGVEVGATPPTAEWAFRVYHQAPTAGDPIPADLAVALKQYGSGKEVAATPAQPPQPGAAGGSGLSFRGTRTVIAGQKGPEPLNVAAIPPDQTYLPIEDRGGQWYAICVASAPGPPWPSWRGYTFGGKNLAVATGEAGQVQPYSAPVVIEGNRMRVECSDPTGTSVTTFTITGDQLTGETTWRHVGGDRWSTVKHQATRAP